ncbi:MAG TPA: hypothetical protein VEK05_03855 [Burkholderiales bacterium]|nr:hypothetical protein [Burkholderiales bacterium]
MAALRFVAVCLLCWCASAAQSQISDKPEQRSATQDLEPLLRSLFEAIGTLSDYRAPENLPPVFLLPQSAIEAKVCDEPCNVSAAYIPHDGIYLAEYLDPEHQAVDRSILLHELVHYLQQGHPKFAHLKGCERERAKEQEAYEIQNAYLASLQVGRRAIFYDGEFDCSGTESMRTP